MQTKREQFVRVKTIETRLERVTLTFLEKERGSAFRFVEAAKLKLISEEEHTVGGPAYTRSAIVWIAEGEI